MKTKLIAAAVAAVFAAPAFAATTITFSGATAVEKQFRSYITTLCSGVAGERRDSAGSAETYTCNLSAAGATLLASFGGTLAAGEALIIQKENGGSYTGVGPVDRAETVKVVNIASCGVGSSSCTLTTATAQIGISDAEPTIHELAVNNPSGGDESFPNLAIGPELAVNAQTFGVVVTKDLRDALQAVQGLTIGSEEVAQMPNLSSALIANLFAGQIGTWGTLTDAAGNGLNALTSTNAACDKDGALAGDNNSCSVESNTVEVCLRSPGSGTGSVLNTHIMRNPWAYRGVNTNQFEFAGLTPSDDSDGTNNNNPSFPFPGPWAHHNVGSSDMGRCLTNLWNANRTAIGYQSLEKVDEGRTNRNAFKYIRVDGVAPTLENVQNGSYRLWAALHVQTRLDEADANVLAFKDAFVSIARDLSDIVAFNEELRDDSAANSTDNRPVGGFRFPEILDGGVPARVGSMSFNEYTPESGNGFNPAVEPVMVFDCHNGLTHNASGCQFRVQAGAEIDVSSTN